MGAIDGMVSGAIAGSVVGIIMGFYAKSQGAKRPPEDALSAEPKFFVQASTPVEPLAVIQAIRDFAVHAEYRIELEDPPKGIYVLGQDVNLLRLNRFHNGIWLPIYLQTLPDGGTLINIGVKSKCFNTALVQYKIRDKTLHDIIQGAQKRGV